MNFLMCYDTDNAGVKETVHLRYSCARITEEVQLGIRAVRAASAASSWVSLLHGQDLTMSMP